MEQQNDINFKMRSLSDYIDALERMFLPFDSQLLKTKTEAGEFQYVALPSHHFIDQLNALKSIFVNNSTSPYAKHEFNSLSFVDVGCGIGSKMFLAKNFFYRQNIFGIDNCEKYIQLAQELVFGNNKTLNSNIILGDILSINYDAYDIIYFYCPFSNYEKQKKLEEHIANTAKPGAFIIGNLIKHFHLWDNEKNFKVLNRDMYYIVQKL